MSGRRVQTRMNHWPTATMPMAATMVAAVTSLVVRRTWARIQA